MLHNSWDGLHYSQTVSWLGGVVKLYISANKLSDKSFNQLLLWLIAPECVFECYSKSDQVARVIDLIFRRSCVNRWGVVNFTNH